VVAESTGDGSAAGNPREASKTSVTNRNWLKEPQGIAKVDRRCDGYRTLQSEVSCLQDSSAKEVIHAIGSKLLSVTD
jgi:hypothetical protein